MISAHTDVVGSLLRPPELLAAREARSAGEIGDREFKAVEDRAVVTDGEMRRLSFQSQLTQAVTGFGEWDIDAFLWGQWRGDDEIGNRNGERPANLGVVEKLARRRHLSAEEFVYLRARTTRIAKVTLPSPSLFVNFWSPERSVAAYPTVEGFLADVVGILRDEVEELARLGASYIQIDAPHYPLLLDPETRRFYESQGWTLDQWLDRGIELDNALMRGLPDVTFGFHLCRGNQGSRWLVEGGYELIARPIFERIAAQRLLLEYDDERSGSFEPLRFVPDDKMVVLGLITTKRPALEAPEDLVDGIHQASRFVDLERLALSPQCGFATSIVGNKLSLQDQIRKLKLVCETARRVWPDAELRKD
ncbi:MAG: cobalamin-independent methionine synthase II family protein [Alphaproteobacteria bacterium]|nr:cobalamin-independent methionine synthase II family protein [Alphaproteobacteria bacterium]MDP6812400.1 cobalamin-independent methionine synthase II family protein [Alphaproteobacteria bacterium]